MALVTPSPWVAINSSGGAVVEHASRGNNSNSTSTCWPADENAMLMDSMNPLDSDPSINSANSANSATSVTSVHASFTPTQLKYQPRAWQRKPSTPAAHHQHRHQRQRLHQHQQLHLNHSRKIWKRVPLQSIATNVNAAWENGGQAGDGIMRPVKKMRIAKTTPPRIVAAVGTATDAIDDDDDDKENAIVGITAKWAREPSPTKSPSPSDRASQLWLSPDTKPVRKETPSDLASGLDSNNSNSYVAPQSLELQSPSAPLPAAIDLDATASVHLSPTANSGRPTERVEDSVHVDAVGDEALFNLSQPEKHQPGVHQPGEVNLLVSVTSSDDSGTQQPCNYSHSLPEEDQDDTAYLQAFLSRTRAQRDANAQLAQPTHSVPSNAASVTDLAGVTSNPDLILTEQTLTPTPAKDNDNANAPVPASGNEAKSTSSSSSSSSKDPGTADIEPQQPSSPSRRPSRSTRVLRPPRITILPNTIALRRLNGSEFVAMQKEARSVATITRSNTRRNKGSAMKVPERLVQLVAEQKQLLELIDGDKGKAKGKKNRKEVVWAETIARMQAAGGGRGGGAGAGASREEVPYVPDPKPAPGDLDFEFGPTGPTEATKPTEQTGAADPIQVAVVTEADPPSSEHQAEEPEQETKTETLLTPLRRCRKENLGNVAGTPKPKAATLELLHANLVSELEEQQQQIQIPKPMPIKKRRTRTATATATATLTNSTSRATTTAAAAGET